MIHQINKVYIKLVGNHPRLPINHDNIFTIKEQSIKTQNDVTIGCELTGLPTSVHLTLCFIPWKEMEECSKQILKNLKEFENIFEVNFTKRCLSKFCTKLVVVYDVNDKSVFKKILEECYPRYNSRNHHFHVSIPWEYNYEERKYVPTWKNMKEEELNFWHSYMKTLRFVNVRYLV